MHKQDGSISRIKSYTKTVGYHVHAPITSSKGPEGLGAIRALESIQRIQGGMICSFQISQSLL